MRLLSVWKHCFGSGFLEYEGRADREEFWLFSLLALPLAVLLVWLMLALDQMFPGLWAQPLPAGEEIPRLLLRLLLLIIWLGLLTPAVCVTIRRLHDMDASGRWVIAALVPGIAALCCWLLTSWQVVAGELPLMVLKICAGGLAVLEALAVVSLGLVFLGDGTHGNNRFGEDPLGRMPQHLPPTDVNGVPLDLEDDEADEVIDLDGVASPEWHDVPRVELDKETEEELRAGTLAREAAPAVQDVVKVNVPESPAPAAEGPTPTEAFAQIGAIKKQIAALKGLQECPSCKAQVEDSAQFCPKCGAKLEDPWTVVDEDVCEADADSCQGDGEKSCGGQEGAPDPDGAQKEETAGEGETP